MNIIFVGNFESEYLKLKEEFEKKGYRCSEIEELPEGKELKEMIKSESDIIVTEMTAGKIDGISLCKDIRTTSSIPQPYIAVYTEQNDDIAQAAAFDSGADAYIIRPVRPLLFVKKIEAMFRARLQNIQKDYVFFLKITPLQSIRITP
jgi:DNA-binding response OmpR family regulator